MPAIDRSRFGPYFSVSVRVWPTRASLDLPRGDVALALEDLGDVGLELGARQRHGVVVRRVRVAQTGQHVCDRVCHCHVLFPLFIRFRLPLHDSRPVMMTWSLSAGSRSVPGRLPLRNGKPRCTQQRAALGIRLRRGDHGDVEAADAVDLVLVDLVEDGLLLETERVVAVAVELLRPTGRGSRGCGAARG